MTDRPAFVLLEDLVLAFSRRLQLQHQHTDALRQARRGALKRVELV